MPLSPGTHIGPYEILAPIGAGGMGEVYRARDPRLGRDVAIKVSAQQFSERFEREAKAIAALNHPNICQVYDVGPNYIVMEYVEGEPLKGPLALDKTIDCSGQILEALDHAHRKGFTHRDLKPANLLVTKQGIKLLDFGLAKQRTTPLKENDNTLTQAPSKPLTRDGQILGTLQYMSPEQLQGKEADPRSDIFSFGCVLYELITGKRAFDGQSAVSVIAAILERPAPSVADVAPPALDRVLKRCLEKDPDKRWQNALDLKSALELSAGQAMEPVARPAPQSRVESLLGAAGWIAAAVLAVIAIGLGVIAYRDTRPMPLRPLLRLELNLGPALGSSIRSGGIEAVISPDGTRLVYVLQNKLWVRKLDGATAEELAGTDGGLEPFFSPDGKWVAFFANGKLNKISVDGGAEIALCDAQTAFNSRGGSWGEDGNIIAALTYNGGLSRIPSGGGTPEELVESNSTKAVLAWPQILPGGKAVLFSAAPATTNTQTGLPNYDMADIKVLSLTDRRSKTLVRGGTFGRYLPSGHLIYISRGTLFAIPFNVDRLEVRGTPVPILDRVAYSNATGAAQLDFSKAGTFAYRSGGAGELVSVQWLDSEGRTQPLLSKPGVYLRHRLSPDNQRLALDWAGDIWVYEWQRDTMTRLTFGNPNGAGPLWSPDGHFIFFRMMGDEGIGWVRADGAGKPQRLTQSLNVQVPYSTSADGKRLYIDEFAGYDGHLWVMPLESDGEGFRTAKLEQVLQEGGSDGRQASPSPDGRWLAYTSTESGTSQVYVRSLPDRGGKWQISNNGGQYPEWSRNGHELFFETLDNHIMVANYTVKGNSFAVDGKPRLWSEKQLSTGRGGNRNYDVAADGKRVVALMPAETEQERGHVIFLENFFDELRRRVPTGK